MLARFLVLLAAIMPLCAQDDVSRYLVELRTRRPSPQERQAALSKQLETTFDSVQRAQLYLQSAQIERNLGDLDAAITAVRAARSLEPGDARISTELASALLARGQTGQVPALLEVDPADGQALIHKADDLAPQHPDLATFCAELAHQLMPADLSVTDTLGTFYMWAGAAEQAATTFGQAVAQAPQVSTYHYHLALANMQRHRNDTALSELRAALDCGPPNDVRAAIQAAVGYLDPHK